ncbi:MAG: 23S rRNA pseudouridine(2604) synthase RluF [Salibacteraceae bacterium]
MAETSGIRINKFLSESGLCSRREADRMIEQGRVMINGKHPEVGQRVKQRDQVRVDGRVIENNQEDAIYLVFNKPMGIVTTTDTKGEKDNIIEYVNYPKRIFPIGRLDKMSEGLILLTSDGDIVNKILRAGNNHEKEYEVSVDKPINDAFIQKMASGVPILGTMTKKCKVEPVSTFTFRIILTQGLNRQIRRMCEHFGYEVQRLKRTRIMNINLDLPPGQWRELTDDELSKIQSMVKNSSKTQKTKPASKSLKQIPEKKKLTSTTSNRGKKKHPKAKKITLNKKNKRSSSSKPRGRKK